MNRLYFHESRHTCSASRRRCTGAPKQALISEGVSHVAAAKVAKIEQDATEEKPRKKRKLKRIILTIVIALVVVLIGVVIWLFWIGALAPWYAAAKYDGLHYITEQEVEDYIESYQAQQGYEDADDTSWAVYLAYYGLTPETLRQSVIQQLVTTEMIEKAAKENDVELTDEEWETYLTNIKNNLAFGDEDVYQETIEAQGMTVEEYEASYRNFLLRTKLYEAVVEMPEATDEETTEYLETNYTVSTETKHIYYLNITDFDSDESYDQLQYTQTVRNAFEDQVLAAEDVDATEAFATFVQTYCTDDDLVSRGGANGWDLDISDYSDDYQDAVDSTEVGEVSDVFEDDEGYSFVYIDTSYTLEPDEDGNYDLSDLPETLQEYFADCAAYELWEDDCDEYLTSLYEDSGCIIYAMPEDASYNVDMDLAEEYAESVMEEEESESDEDASDDDSTDEDATDDSDEDESSTEAQDASDEE